MSGHTANVHPIVCEKIIYIGPEMPLRNRALVKKEKVLSSAII